jgi:hypothetical protein
VKRAFAAACVAFVVLAAPTAAWAQLKVVQFKDGRPPLVGTVTESADSYEVTTRTGKQTVLIDQVASIADYVSPREEFQKRLSAIRSGDVAGHYALADWAYKQGLLEESRAELRAVLTLQPNHENAKLLLNIVEKALLEQKEKEPAPRAPGAPVPAGPTRAGLSVLSQLMSFEDVQRIRRSELRRGDRALIEFRNDVLRRFVQLQVDSGRFSDAAAARKFYSQTAVDQVVQIMQEPASRELQSDIIVKADPRFMTVFKRSIWPMLAVHCAAPDCHGAPRGAGRLKLYAGPVQDDRAYYTNFYILDAYEAGQNRMINRNLPAQSLLLQYGLPADDTHTAHPGPKSAVFMNEAQYNILLDWITNVLANPRPVYGLDYRAAGEKPHGPTLSLGSQPASQPTSSPASRPGSRPAAGATSRPAPASQPARPLWTR